MLSFGDVIRRRRGGSGETAMFDDREVLVEREHELAECATALDSAVAGRGGMVVVEAAAGIGKTELLRALRRQARARDARVLVARGLEVEREHAFGAVRQLLEPVVRALSPSEAARLFSGAAKPAGQLFGPGFAEPGAHGDSAFATLNALYWLLASVAEREPLVLAIDDAHWLDPPSLLLLDFLVPRIEEFSALVVVATRPLPDGAEDAPLGRILADPCSTVIRPGPLSRSGVREFVRSRLGEDPDPGLVDACAEVTAGNPFYLDELLREVALHCGDVRSPDAATVRRIAPRRIALTLRFRGAAASDGLALARALAVLGDGAALGQVAALAGLSREPAAAVADALTRESILGAGPGLAFAHPIVRTAVYADLAPGERAGLHARAARLLHTAGAPIERIAAHLLKTEPARDGWVVEMLRAAADAALRQGAPEAACRFLRRALAEPAAEADRPRLLLELARAEASAGDAAAMAHFAEAYALATDDRTRSDVAEAAAPALFVTGRGAEALAMLAAAADALADEDAPRALELEALLVALAMNDPSSAALHRVRLDRVGEDLAADSPGARMMLCQLAYRRMWRSFDAARAAELVERALRSGNVLEEGGSESAELNAAAMTLIYADRVEQAARLLEAAAAHARERGSRHGFGLVWFLRGELAYRLGRLQDAEADAHATLAVCYPSEVIGGVAAATGLLIAGLLERGALDEAEVALTSALELIHRCVGKLPPEPHYSLLLGASGRLKLARGDLAGGLDDLHECGRRNAALGARNPVFVPWRIDAALAHRSRGELDAARQLCQEELAAARDWGTPGAIGAAQRLDGLLSTGEEAIARLREATAAMAMSPARLERARTLVDLGAALRRANRRTEARQPLAQGLDLCDRCRARVLAQRAREELAMTGARPRRARLSGVDALTPSERRVAQMAASGSSNVDIAQTLFVTRKTVEKHLGNAYAKLNVSSRDELPAIFAQQRDR